jgi:hypothetical protein
LIIKAKGSVVIGQTEIVKAAEGVHD